MNVMVKQQMNIMVGAGKSPHNMLGAAHDNSTARQRANLKGSMAKAGGAAQAPKQKDTSVKLFGVSTNTFCSVMSLLARTLHRPMLAWM
jgi:hypothetical protein